MNKINTNMMDNTNSVNEARAIGEIERYLDTIQINSFDVADTIKRALLREGYAVKMKPIINENGHQMGEEITVSRIEKIYY